MNYRCLTVLIGALASIGYSQSGPLSGHPDQASEAVEIKMLVPRAPNLGVKDFRIPDARIIPHVEHYSRKLAVFSGSVSGIPKAEGIDRITAPPLTAVLHQQFAIFDSAGGGYRGGVASGGLRVESPPSLVWEPGKATITTLTNVFRLEVEQFALRAPQGFVLRIHLKNRSETKRTLTVASVQVPTIRRPREWSYGWQFQDSPKFIALGHAANGTAVHWNREGAAAFGMPGARVAAANSADAALEFARKGLRYEDQPKTGSPATVLYRSVSLAPGEEAVFHLVLTTGASPEAVETALGRLMRNPEAAAARARATMESDIRIFLARLPALSHPDPRVMKFYHLAALQLLYARWKVGKTFILDPWYATLGLDSGGLDCYAWDLAYARVAFSLLDPAGMRAMLVALLGAPLNEHYSIGPLHGTGIGPFYAYNPYSFTASVDEYLKVTGDRSILHEKRKGKTLLEWLVTLAQFGERDRDPDHNHLIDYGTDRNLLEIKTTGTGPGYIHEVPSPNAERAYVFETVAGILAGERDAARYADVIKRFKRNALEVRQAVNNILWLKQAGWYGSRQKDGAVVPVYSIQVFNLLQIPGMVPPGRARRLVGHLNNDEFLGPWGIRSLSAKDRLWDWTDTDWSGPMSYIGIGPQLVSDLFQAGFIDKAWQAFQRILWWPQHLAILPQCIANDDYTFKFPQSAPFGGRVSASRTNEIAGAAGVGLIVRGLFGVKPGRDGSIGFSTGRRSADGPIALSYPYRGRIWNITQRHAGLDVRRDDGFAASLFREDGALRFSFDPRSIIVEASARGGGPGRITLAVPFFLKYFGVRGPDRLNVRVAGRPVKPRIVAGRFVLEVGELGHNGTRIEIRPQAKCERRIPHH